MLGPRCAERGSESAIINQFCSHFCIDYIVDSWVHLCSGKIRTASFKHFFTFYRPNDLMSANCRKIKLIRCSAASSDGCTTWNGGTALIKAAAFVGVFRFLPRPKVSHYCSAREEFSGKHGPPATRCEIHVPPNKMAEDFELRNAIFPRCSLNA